VNYNSLKGTARSLLAKFGQPMTLVKTTGSSYDATTGANTLTTSSTTDLGVILRYGDALNSAPDSLIKQDDQQIFIQMSVAPSVTDKITVAGVNYDIVSVKPIEPAGINVLYELQVRK
jgi:hypothetical protein